MYTKEALEEIMEKLSELHGAKKEDAVAEMEKDSEEREEELESMPEEGEEKEEKEESIDMAGLDPKFMEELKAMKEQIKPKGASITIAKLGAFGKKG